ncbi:MAG: Nudix family hydrolase [Gammaproteobacteria bacterium]|nr:Nudix family hydrolase [Gammaproteobacteria bacterium]
MIRVAVGVLQRDDGRTLLMQRLPGTFREGQWECPGGKIEAGEDSLQALVRELHEELGIKVGNARPRITLRHAYPEKTVLLEVWQVTQFTGQPHNLEGHQLRWVTPAELRRSETLDADRPIITSLELPDTYVITPTLATDDASESAQWLKQLELTLDQGVSLLQLRCPGWSPANFARLAKTVARYCDASGTKLLLNGDPEQVLSLSEKLGAAGCHFPVRYLDRLTGMQRPDGLLIGASCHSAAELAAAASADVDFCVLGPVLPTASHRQRSALNWPGFEDAVKKANLPVFALGGLAAGDLETAWQRGAQGVAGISGFWSRRSTSLNQHR